MPKFTPDPKEMIIMFYKHKIFPDKPTKQTSLLLQPTELQIVLHPGTGCFQQIPPASSFPTKTACQLSETSSYSNSPPKTCFQRGRRCYSQQNQQAVFFIIYFPFSIFPQDVCFFIIAPSSTSSSTSSPTRKHNSCSESRDFPLKDKCEN